MHRLFLDTNIIMQYALGYEPGCSTYMKFIEYASLGKLALYTSSHSLKDAYYNINMVLKRQERKETGTLSESAALGAKEAAWAVVELVGAQLNIVSVGRNEHERAFIFRPIHNDYEDDLQLAAAYAAKASLFITEDQRLKSHSPVAALSPTEAAALLEAEFAHR